jgi:hypothetical protein
MFSRHGPRPAPAFSQSVKALAKAGCNSNELLLRIHKTLSDTGDGALSR